jgi:ABC-type branched-subunit amino acid transport system permease subunit
MNSTFGQVVRAVRDNETRAILEFTLSAGVAELAGANEAIAFSSRPWLTCTGVPRAMWS